MKKLYSVFVGCVVVLMCLSFLNISAQSEKFIDVQDKATIRYKTETVKEGLKFTANVNKSATGGVYGMYLVYGKTTKEELLLKINEAQGGTFYINEKEVIHVKTSTLSNENTFSVIITGIPDTNYVDEITVLGYAKVRDIAIYADNAVTKSIAEVVFSDLNNGEEKEELNEIVNSMQQKVVLRYNALNDVELTKSFYEYDYEKLKEKFNEDFKEVNVSGFLDLETNQDDLYRFYQKPNMKKKWGFLLDYFLYLSGNETLNGQIDNIKDGVSSESLEELIYALTNFFNSENYRKNEVLINFKDKENYLALKDFNDKVYINPSDYDIYAVGDRLMIPDVEDDPDAAIGYAFDYFLIDDERYNPHEFYTIPDYDVAFVKHYSLREYTITFLKEDGGYLGVRTVKHNDTLLQTPEYAKEGQVIVYWLDANDEIVNSKTQITEDKTVRPVFKQAIREINFVVDKSNYIVVSASENIEYELDPKDKMYNYLYITPKEGYGFTRNVQVNVTFTDGTTAKFINQTIEAEYIEYIYDDPGWTGIY